MESAEELFKKLSSVKKPLNPQLRDLRALELRQKEFDSFVSTHQSSTEQSIKRIHLSLSDFKTARKQKQKLFLHKLEQVESDLKRAIEMAEQTAEQAKKTEAQRLMGFQRLIREQNDSFSLKCEHQLEQKLRVLSQAVTYSKGLALQREAHLVQYDELAVEIRDKWEQAINQVKRGTEAITAFKQEKSKQLTEATEKAQQIIQDKLDRAISKRKLLKAQCLDLLK